MALELYDAFAPQVESIWRALEPSTSVYFLRWSWIENWLACLPRAAAPALAVAYRGGEPIAACFLGRNWTLRHGRALHLNMTGVDALDEVVIEHNGVVGPGSLADILAELPRDWDQLFVTSADAVPAVPRHLRVRVDREVACHHVDLDRVRASGYAALLGRSTRAQLRRSERRAGTLTVEIATSTASALAIYDELIVHHQYRWNARGMPGAFADPWFDRFHRRLIERRHGSGEIQLVRVRSGSHTIGCLYNFVCAGRVLFYQSGIPAPSHTHDKPGYLCHARAIEHSAAEGHAVYDLLGGDARYKENLATGSTRLVSMRIQQRRAWLALEDLATRALRSWRGRSSS